MRYNIKVFVLIFSMILISGCSTKLMTPVIDGADNIKIDENSSCVTFFRTSLFGSSIQAPIAEYVDGDVKFVGISSYNTRFRYVTTPGNHIFVVGGESGNVLKAELKAGKNYYVHVTPWIGFFKSRFDLEAIHQNKIDEIKNKITKCKLVMSNSQSQDWFNSNKNSMKKKAIAGLEKFEKKKDKNPFMLNVEDGVDILY